MPQRVLLAADHAGYLLKKHLHAVLQAKGYDAVDLGCFSMDAVDYPEYANAVVEGVKADPQVLGILVCGTGIGMCITANKHSGIRAALCHDTYAARLAREHNDSNILCLGAHSIGFGLAEVITLTWLQGTFLGGRHKRRNDQISEIEQHRLS
ncbi:MAG: ribose 5-phosphate isomerase B [Symbiobacteriaceae bacterium]|nr:ribose 5-phosphate isomerase B [Symbiobacteriaceae bacterium]